jgi:hypothetical protein
MGSVPWESQAPIAAFSTDEDARASCAKLEARHERYQAASDKFYDRLNELAWK